MKHLIRNALCCLLKTSLQITGSQKVAWASVLSARSSSSMFEVILTYPVVLQMFYVFK